MRAVWSFWTKPFYAQHGTLWPSIAHQFFAWVLSVESAKQHFAETRLVTDDDGAVLLTEEIGLEFSSVTKELNALNTSDPRWFTLGKILAYQAQEKPFVHLDYDVFLWKPLPDDLLATPIFAQNPEYFSIRDSDWYRPDLFEELIHAHTQGWVPDEWAWYRQHTGHVQKAICCGILGANNLAFVKHYTNQVLNTLHHPHNKDRLATAVSLRAFSILLEQYTLTTCIDYHQAREGSLFKDISMNYLFKSTLDAYSEASEKGFTHLMLGNKRNTRFFADWLVRTVKKRYPEYYERCITSASKLNIPVRPARYVLISHYKQEAPPSE